MAESFFNIFNDHHNTALIKKNTNQPLGYSENNGKSFATNTNIGPVKPSELKSSEPKKSFLLNSGAAIQTTPLKPFLVNKNILQSEVTQLKIYTDKENLDDSGLELEFEHKPDFLLDNYHKDILQENFDEFDFDQMFGDNNRGSTPEPLLGHSIHMSLNMMDDDFSNLSVYDSCYEMTDSPDISVLDISDVMLTMD